MIIGILSSANDRPISCLCQAAVIAELAIELGGVLWFFTELFIR